MTVELAVKRFEDHLSRNPNVMTADGMTQMLAGRDIAQFPKVELNGVLRRYIALTVPIELSTDLPLIPTLRVHSPASGLICCLWELDAPVTFTANGHLPPQRFFNDVSQAIVDHIQRKPAAVSADIQVQRNLIPSPLYPQHMVDGCGVGFNLKALKEAFPQLRTGSYQAIHFRSGAFPEEFEAMRSVANSLCRSMSCVEGLTTALTTWAASAPEMRNSAMSSTARASMVKRVATYVFSRSHRAISDRTAARIRRAAKEVAQELKVNELGAMSRLSKLVATRAGVSVRSVKRALSP